MVISWTVVFVGLFVITGAISQKCKWNQYYDDNVSSCAPCHEICNSMEITRTQEECRQQCGDYLRSLACTFNEYYDDVTSECAPCSELCDHSNITRTNVECSDRCVLYLRAKACTRSEYFDEKEDKCSSCQPLCQGERASNESCYSKCSQFLNDNPPVDSGVNPNPVPVPPADSFPGGGDPSLHISIIVILVVAAVMVVASIGAAVAVYYAIRSRKNNKGQPEDPEVNETLVNDGAARPIYRIRNNNGRPGEGTVEMERRPILAAQVSPNDGPFMSARVLNLPYPAAATYASSPAALSGAAATYASSPAALSGAAAASLPHPLSPSHCDSPPAVAFSFPFSGERAMGNTGLHMAERGDDPAVDLRYGIPECDPLAPSSAAYQHTRRSSLRSSSQESRLESRDLLVTLQRQVYRKA